MMRCSWTQWRISSAIDDGRAVPARALAHGARCETCGRFLAVARVMDDVLPGTAGDGPAPASRASVLRRVAWPAAGLAAELAVPDRAEVARAVGVLAGRLERYALMHVRGARQNLGSCLRSSVFRDPLSLVRQRAQRVDELSHRLRAAQGQRLAAARRRFAPAEAKLASLHPVRLAELSGYRDRRFSVSREINLATN